MIRASLGLLIGLSGFVGAQLPDRSQICWRARPLPDCRTWAVTELAVETPVISTVSPGFPGGKDFKSRVAFTAGAMKNVRSDAAVGLTATVMSGRFPGRIETRYRRWTESGRGLDLSFGYTGGQVRGAASPSVVANGMTASAGISGAYFGADARIDLLSAADGRTVHGTYLSFRAGSKAGPLIAASGFLLTGVLVLIANSGGAT